MTNRRVLLRNRPVGEPKPSDFEIVDAPLPEPQEGDILVRTIWLSLDPYMRGRMNDVKSYTAPVELGQPMVGGTVGEVVKSRDAAFTPGDFVLSYGGWQAYHVAKAAGARVGPFGPLKLDPKAAPISTALGILGMPGLTAYVGLYDIGQPKPGETVVVSAAAGAEPRAGARQPRHHPWLPRQRSRRPAAAVPRRLWAVAARGQAEVSRGRRAGSGEGAGGAHRAAARPEHRQDARQGR